MRATVTLVARVLEGPDKGRRFDLVSPNEWIVGRCSVARRRGVGLKDPQVSAKHARITVTPSKLILIEDLGSTNGTLVNDTMLVAKERVSVAQGQQIMLGSTQLQISLPDDETIPCVVCGKDLSALSVVDRHKHTNGCLDSEKSEALVAVLKNDPNADLKDAHAESKQVSCAVCGRDLSSLTVQRRQEHVSFCLDSKAAPSSSTVSKKRQRPLALALAPPPPPQQQQQQQQQKRAKKTRKTRKPKAEPKFANVYVRASSMRACPVCNLVWPKPLNPITQEPHVKFCCNKYGVSENDLEALCKATKARRREMQKAASIFPPSPSSPSSSSSSPPSSKPTASKSRGAALSTSNVAQLERTLAQCEARIDELTKYREFMKRNLEIERSKMFVASDVQCPPSKVGTAYGSGQQFSPQRVMQKIFPKESKDSTGAEAEVAKDVEKVKMLERLSIGVAGSLDDLVKIVGEEDDKLGESDIESEEEEELEQADLDVDDEEKTATFWISNAPEYVRTEFRNFEDSVHYVFAKGQNELQSALEKMESLRKDSSGEKAQALRYFQDIILNAMEHEKRRREGEKVEEAKCPQYASMNEQDLNAAAAAYGFKSMPRDQLVRKLTHTWHMLHPECMDPNPMIEAGGDVEERVITWIQNKPDLWQRILVHEVVEVSLMQNELECAGIRISKKGLQSILDKHAASNKLS